VEFLGGFVDYTVAVLLCTLQLGIMSEVDEGCTV
jgi:hypothetical protein